jgi:hypothetical protein
MGRSVAFSIVAAALLVFGLSGVALASANYFPPIYNDYAADRDLDGTYTRAELKAYLIDPEVDQYGDPVVVAELDALVWRMLDDNRSALPWRHATPREIYDDYAADGVLDWNYYDADIQAFLNDPYIQQYSDPVFLAQLDALLSRMLRHRETEERDSFPFTGAPPALLILGAAGLAGAGLGLRRLVGRRGSA